MTTDTTEKGLETLIVEAMTGTKPDPAQTDMGREPSALYGVTGWILGRWQDYDREYAVDLVQLTEFLKSTQPEVAESLDLENASPTRQKFLARLQGEVAKRGIIEVLRNGLKHGKYDIDLFYGTPTPGNTKAEERYALNRFSVTRQLRYSRGETQLALDLCLFINGLPVATFELKNSLTKQTVEDAVEQYKRDRDSRELLFQFGRCMVHFAVDDHEVKFCTQLNGKNSWFLPFNQGYNDGTGNPPNPAGIKTDYLWKKILTPQGLTDILENYAQVVEEKDEKTGKKKKVQIFPRYHQLDVVRKLLAHAEWHGAGMRYLVQHSAGSGKSNSIAWLAHQLISLKKDDKEIFDSIIVITDRRVLDKQIRDTIKQFAQVGSTVGHAERSGDLRKFIESGKKIIISTVQKFPFILDEIGNEHRGRKFAIIIDEAHSSQGGRTAAAMSEALSDSKDQKDPEDTINDALQKRMEARKMLPNASYFAFTATPKNKTLELFGEPYKDGDKIKHRPFHNYTMKQAIQEGFILDVLRYYTPVNSYYKLIKTVESDPEFDTKKAKKKLRKYVESHDYAIRLKAEIIVDHFQEQVIALNKIGGQARAMVVTNGIERAIQYYHAIRDYLLELNSPYKAIVAFSGEHEYGGVKVTEATLNGFPSSQIEDKIEEEPYRFLICADKFQTGYDEPLLHTMYVDKVLSGIKAVQTLSRLNRAHPKKHDVFVLDFMNDTDTIQDAFSDYYRTTVLSDETDPNKLHDLKSDLDSYQAYSPEQIEQFVELYLGGADRDKLDPILDVCVATYKDHLDEDEQVDFKSKAKAFSRTYGFLASILPYTNADWEKLSIFLNFLIPKLPAPREEDLSKGILEAIDMDSYRVEKQAVVNIQLPDSDSEIEPVPTEAGGFKPEPELDRLSNILKTFNDQFGNIRWTDSDRVHRLITEEIPARVAADVAYQNAKKNSDKQNAKIEHDKALARVMIALMKDDTQLFKLFSDNESFRRTLTDAIFERTYSQ
ncbi:MAG: type I restriction endonuclease subunit R [Methanosarcina sp.]|jgi:type I restriction enzyme R subunit|uniref:Type I restriction-modification system restriction subunit n=1 Tax=Methanosarcina mazei (strain ATCC BAA-159 / DSM 3647 / Goe1 / Go1 / JCM 11833 / OCM 88) TaxID=192952 RepID=Q8PSV0_METMA|nr:type I restriction endonuclease subunit R [Methanosarcina mazei]AAM32672.1 type I restriction-modification system restriction subunit [Methanosarcina mazei Go1]MDY0245886.1 type I restriction endonuclease subunit R [Methanosarcina mazei]